MCTTEKEVKHMIIEFQLTEEKWKELANAISEIIEAPAEYQFMPTCAYKIGDFYTVSKEGNLEISDSVDHKKIENLTDELVSKGYDVPQKECENRLTVEMPLTDIDETVIDRLRKIVENKGRIFQDSIQNWQPQIHNALLSSSIGYDWCWI